MTLNFAPLIWGMPGTQLVEIPELSRPQSSLLRKVRSARGDGKEEKGEFLPSPFLLPITPRASLHSQERRLGTSQIPEYDQSHAP